MYRLLHFYTDLHDICADQKHPLWRNLFWQFLSVLYNFWQFLYVLNWLSPLVYYYIFFFFCLYVHSLCNMIFYGQYICAISRFNSCFSLGNKLYWKNVILDARSHFYFLYLHISYTITFLLSGFTYFMQYYILFSVFWLLKILFFYEFSVLSKCMHNAFYNMIFHS